MFGLPLGDSAFVYSAFFVFLRIAGLVAVSPVFGRRNIPVLLKGAFCLMLTVVTVYALPPAAPHVGDNILPLVAPAANEVLLGMAMGYITQLAFAIPVSAGHIIDLQIGFGLSNFFDTSLGVQMPISGSLLNAVAMFVFFAGGGFSLLIRSLVGSFSLVPPGAVVLNRELAALALGFFTSFLLIVIKVAVPLLAAAILAEAALGVLGKTMPQMNIFVVGIPLKLILGLLMLLLMVPVFCGFMDFAFEEMIENIQKLMQGLV